MSTPRVGLEDHDLRLGAEPLPTATFCWLPPDSVPTAEPMRLTSMAKRAAIAPAFAFAPGRDEAARCDRADPRR
jgi:hypothetical protein